MMKVLSIALFSALCLSSHVCANTASTTAVSPESLQRWFDKGVKSFQKEKYSKAIVSLSRFHHAPVEDALNEEWALFFLALSYEREGLFHAAVDTFRQVLEIASNPQTVNASIRALERISFEKPFDKSMLIDRTIVSLDFDFIEPELKNFIYFHQGKYNWSRGFVAWGHEVFKKIEPTSKYYPHYLLVDAQRLVFYGEIKKATENLTTILNVKELDATLRKRAASYLARLQYELKHYDQAASGYEQVLALGGNHKAILERAWSLYMTGEPEAAFGLLHAFSAPSFQKSFTPEFFILKTHIQKDHCHYDEVAETQDAFFDRYDASLDGIYARQAIKAESFIEIHKVLLQNDAIREAWEFYLQLQTEEARTRISWPKETRQYLREMYQLKIDQMERTLTQLLEQNYEFVANSILVYAEEMNLLGYEMGVERFQSSPGTDEIAGTQTKISKASLEGQVRFPVDGEFWNDELKDYMATLSNDCLTTEAWSNE